MKRLILALSLILSTSVLAQTPEEADALKQAMQGMEVSQVGMCDQFRTSLVQYKAEDGRTAFEYIPLAPKRYIVVIKDDKKTYFLKENQQGQEVIMNLKPIDWGSGLMRDGPNFFVFHFFPDRRSDCFLTPLRR